MRIPILLLSLAMCACTSPTEPAPATDADVPPPEAMSVRIATYNVSLYDDADGGVIRRLEAGDEAVHRVAAVIRHTRPDILLLNEFDYDADGRAADLFQRNYLESDRDGPPPLRYEHRYFAAVNTGVPSGLNLDGNDTSGSGDDAWGYGKHPGQYGMLVLSRFPIARDAVRSFTHLRWSTMPGAQRPLHPDGTPFHPDATWNALRLSSKSHWDVPIAAPGGTLHFLVSHPTPPVFDGDEDRNGRRNFDEIRLWSEYVAGTDAPWLCDDAGRCGGIGADARFVIAGDQNSDPDDGDSLAGSIAQLLQHPRIDASFVPRADGGAARAAEYGLPRRGDPRSHTGDFGPRAGTLRLDYLLPSRTLRVRDGAIFWPVAPPQHVEWASASDHHLVWLDLDATSPLPQSEDPR